MLKSLLKSALGVTLLHYRGAPKGAVALTFDDGPSPWTPSVLRSLNKFDVKATFFLIGKRAYANKDCVIEIVESGCEVANHSWSHPFLQEISTDELKHEISQFDDFITPIIGRRPYFRPPYGDLTPGLLGLLIQQRRRGVLWSRVLGGDEKSELMSVDEISTDLGNNPILDGDIILLHDTSCEVADAIPMILEHIQGRGLRAVTLTELLS